jgi:hypothetical protein
MKIVKKKIMKIIQPDKMLEFTLKHKSESEQINSQLPNIWNDITIHQFNTSKSRGLTYQLIRQPRPKKDKPDYTIQINLLEEKSNTIMELVKIICEKLELEQVKNKRNH